MQMLLFSLVLVCLYFGSMYGFYVWLQKQAKQKINACLNVGCGTFLLGAFMLGLVGSTVIFEKPMFMQYTWIVGACFAVMCCAAKFEKVKEKAIWVPLMSAVGVYALHQIIPSVHMDIMSAIILTIVWSIVMSIVMLFDRLPLLNFLTIGTWAMAFTTMYVLSLFGSSSIAVLGLLMLAPLWGMLNILVRYGEGRFGPYATSLLGFVMGGIIALCCVSGSYGSAMALLSYYIFEGFFFLLAWVGFHPFGMQKGEFVLERVLSEHNPAPIIRVIFYRLLVLSLIAALMWQTNKIAILMIIILVVLMDTYNRLKGAGAPSPSIRSMWQDTKAGLKQIWENFRAKEAIVSEKDKSTTPKTPKKSQNKLVKKTTTKRKKKK